MGEALEVFSYLEKGLGRGFFPAWMGFFAYEFARHLGLPTREPLPGLPEAAFCYYPEASPSSRGARGKALLSFAA